MEMVPLNKHMTNDNNNSSMPELLQDVAGRLVSVEEGLAALDNHKTAINNSADTVKGEISSAVENEMTVLRNRERQLIRQVEVASSQQHCEVNLTQAQLLQHKGALAVTRTILDNCPKNEIESPAPLAHQPRCNGSAGSSVRNTIATTVNCLHHHDVAGLLEHSEKLLRVPLVSVCVDEAPLQSAIQRWGRVNMSTSLSHSDLLPHCLEEYGDADHHVLHKSVQPAGGPSQPIDVRRPYILAARAGVNSNGCNKAVTASLFGAEKDFPGHDQQRAACDMRKLESSPVKEDLMKWLHRMQLDTEEELALPAAQQEYNRMLCVEEACQATEPCTAFSACLMAGQCKKNAQEKLDQTARWQLQQQNQSFGDHGTSQGLEFAMDLSFTPRKRRLSESCDPKAAAQAVISHMTTIRSSNDGTWLMPPNFDHLNVVNNRQNAPHVDSSQGFKYIENLNIDSPIKLERNIKKQKLSHLAPNAPSCCAILYKAPNSSWVLPRKANEPISPSKVSVKLEGEELSRVKRSIPALSRVPEFNNTSAQERKDNSVEDVTKIWLLKSSTVAVKKAYCDKENNLCRAGMMKSQCCTGSIENLMDKIDRMSVNGGPKPAILSDIEQKESWLLQQCSTYKPDNKVWDEVMNKKAEWLSNNSSMTSFSIITDSDTVPNSWLLASQM